MGQPFSPADYLAALKALLPRGRAWRAALGSVQEQVLTALAAGLARLDAGAVALLRDAFPEGAVQLLPEWELSTGLPDPCAGEAPTLQQRQAQVVARLANSGGQSAAFFIAYAKRLGFDITIVEHAPLRFGRSFGSPFGGTPWAHSWTVVAPLNTITPFRFGESAFGEPFEAFGNAVLECELRALAPAQTVVLFSYA